MVTTKLNLSMTEPQVRQIYAKQGDTGRVLDITLDQTPEDGTLRILRPDGVEVTSEAVTGGEVSESGETVTFDSLTEADVTELTVGIEPIQDLNGYDKPWVGGAGKNKLVYPYTDTTKTASGITFTDNGDGSIKLNGTATANIDFYLLGEQATYYSSGLASGSYTMRVDSESGTYTGDINKFVVEAVGNTLVGNGITSGGSTFQLDSTKNYRIFVRVLTGTIVNNLVLRPMIYLATETDPTWQPYSNICPITGHDEVTVTRTGKNLLPPMSEDETINGVVWHVNEDNSISISGTASGNSIEDFGRGHLTLKPGTYTTNRAKDGVTCAIWENSSPARLIDADGGTFVLTQDTPIFIRFYVPSGNTVNTTIYPQLELGSTATAYEPYQGSTYTTSLGQTVYGGTLDMVTGTLTLTHALGVLDGTGILYYIDSQSGSSYTTAYVQTTDFDSVIDKTASGISNMFEVRNASMWGTDVVALQIANSVSSVRLRIPKSLLATEDVDGVRAWLTANPVQIYYKLATPVTYTLTAQQIKTLVGINNVWASSGDIVNITFTYGGLLSELPSDATSVVGKCYCDVEQDGVSSMPFTLNVKKNERQ